MARASCVDQRLRAFFLEIYRGRLGVVKKKLFLLVDERNGYLETPELSVRCLCRRECVYVCMRMRLQKISEETLGGIVIAIEGMTVLKRPFMKASIYWCTCFKRWVKDST